VQTALREEFGKDASAIIAKLKAGESLSDEELGAHDTIQDLVDNNGVEVESLDGWSSADNDTFTIAVMQFGSAFWIAASEFDDIAYFDTLEGAKAAAERIRGKSVRICEAGQPLCHCNRERDESSDEGYSPRHMNRSRGCLS
jgi:hypothetical protein